MISHQARKILMACHIQINTGNHLDLSAGAIKKFTRNGNAR